jgi:RHS repeat-associated protein
VEPGVIAPKNGYVYVYLSNESITPVYFDNFKVGHERGQIVAEDHYYAYGLKIAGISSKALSSSLNPSIAKYGYQGSYAEEVTEFELNYNEFALRTYDPQLGRWLTPDPYNEFASPYVGMGGDPANLTDPSGGLTAAGIAAVSALGGAILGAGFDAFTGGDGRGMAYGAAIGLGMGIGFNMSIDFMAQAFQGLGVAAQSAGAAVGSTPPPTVNTPSADNPQRGGPNRGNAPPNEYTAIVAADGTVVSIKMTGTKGEENIDYVTYVMPSRAPSADGVWTETYSVEKTFTSGPGNAFPHAQQANPTPGTREIHGKCTECEAALWLVPTARWVSAAVRVGFKFALKLGMRIVPKAAVKTIPNITYLTKAGKYPSWSAVKSRYWKLMNGGKVPTGTAKVRVRATGEIKNIKVSKELHHINGRTGADPHRFSNLQEVWPWEHQALDASRHTGYDFIQWVK